MAATEDTVIAMQIPGLIATIVPLAGPESPRGSTATFCTRESPFRPQTPPPERPL